MITQNKAIAKRVWAALGITFALIVVVLVVATQANSASARAFTRTGAPNDTPTLIGTDTPIDTYTDTPTETPADDTDTPVPTDTPMPSYTGTSTNTPTDTPTNTFTHTSTFTRTPTLTNTPTLTRTPVACATVVWNNGINVTVTGNSIQKTGGTGSTWDAGAVSSMAIQSGDGYVQATVDVVSTYRMFGLSNGDTNQSQGDIDYAAYFAGNTLMVYERGLYKGSFGSLSIGDVIRVSVEGGVVKYYRNGSLVYSSTASPTYPLLLDTSINSAGGRISNAYICGANLGPNATFTPPPTFTSTQTCTSTPTRTFTASRTPTRTLTATLTSTSTPLPGCEEVVWANSVNVTIRGTSIQKTGGAASTWDAGAVSSRAVQWGDGYVQASVDAVNTYRMFGLSNGDTNQSHADIDFAAYLAGSTLMVYERGLSKGSFGSLSVGDTVRVAVEGGVVKYYRNGALVYTSASSPTYPLLMDTAINSSYGRIANAYICGANLGPNATFTPTGTSTPTATRTNTPTYTPTNTSTNTPTATATYTPTNSGTPTNTATASSSYADITIKPYGTPGIVNELNLATDGVDSWRRMGDAYSPAFGMGSGGNALTPNPEHPRQPYGYLFKVDVPPSYTYQDVLVQIYDPDSYNRPGPPPTWPSPPNATNTRTPTRTPVADQYASCSNPAPTPPSGGGCSGPNGNSGMDYDPFMHFNAFTTGRPAFWRIDEIRTPYTTTLSGQYNSGFANVTQYTLWHFNPHNSNAFADPASLSDQPGGSYLARYTVGSDAYTDLSWYRPPGFDVQLYDGGGNPLFEREASGGFYFYLYVQSIAGSSENNYDLRAGPPDLNSTQLCATPCYINQLYLDNSRNPTAYPDWQDGGARIYAKRALPLNMDIGSSFPLAFAQISSNLAGQTVGIRHFDQDCNNGCGNIMQYQMSICNSPYPLSDDRSWTNVATGYVGDNNEWVAPPDASHPDGYPDPDPVPIPAQGTALYNTLFGDSGQCPTSWLRVQTNPSYMQDTTTWEIPLLGLLRR